MTLIKTSFLNGFAVIVKLLTLLGINKILAVYVGPAGYAALGQFQNALLMISTLASGAINTGVTKYTAEYAGDEKKLHSLWRTAGSLAFFGSLIMAIIIAVFSEQLAAFFLNEVGMYSVFLWLAAGLVFLTMNSLLLAIVNGRKEILLYVIANIVGSLFSLIAIGVMAVCYGLYGALVSLAIYQSLSFFVTVFVCRKSTWFKLCFLIGEVDRAIAKKLFQYTAMALTSAACLPISQILVRNYLSAEFGLEAAGYWEAMTRLSSAYLLLITSTLSVYYLPRLSELMLVKALKAEVVQGYKYILPCAVFMGFCIYVLRDFIISTLFTNDFSPMRDLFAFQMIGDTLKIGSWILAYLMLSKAMFKMFIVTEVVFAISFFLMVVVLTDLFGFVGVTVAYAFNYLVYWLVMIFLMRRKFKSAVLNNEKGVLC